MQRRRGQLAPAPGAVRQRGQGHGRHAGIVTDSVPDRRFTAEEVDAAVAALSASDRELLGRMEPAELVQLEGLLRKFLAGLEIAE